MQGLFCKEKNKEKRVSYNNNSANGSIHLSETLCCDSIILIKEVITYNFFLVEGEAGRGGIFFRRLHRTEEVRKKNGTKKSESIILILTTLDL